MKCRLLAAATAVGLAVVGFSQSATAGLIGSSVNVDFYYPDLGTLHCSNGSALVGGGTEYPSSCVGFSPASIDIGDTQVVVVTSVPFAAAAFDGFVMTILSGPSILSVSYNAGLSTMGNTSLAFDATFASFNFAGQGPGMAVFDIATVAVPEPGTLALFGLGLAGLGALRRRKAA